MYIRNILIILLMLVLPTTHADQGPQLGRLVDPSTVEQWDRDIFPDGQGLPDGSGNAVNGKKVYQQYCLVCHGVNGSGDSADELAGAMHSLTDAPPDKTIGTYWPYATTIFDFTRRSMPINAPGSLNNDQLYAVTAYLLYLNGLIRVNEIMDKTTLPRVKMPNRHGFINVYAPSR